MSKMIVGLMSYDSHSNYGHNTDEVLKWVREDVEECTSQLSTLSNARPAQLKGIYVAPEYLFTAPATGGRRVAMTTPQKDLIEQKLKAISQNNPNVLIVAGTLFYQEDVVGANRHKMGGSLISNEMELKKAYAKAFRSSENLTMLQIAKIDIKKDVADGKVDESTLSNKQAGELRDFIDNMYSWDHHTTHCPGLLELAKAMNKADESGGTQRRARNCAYLFLNGSRVGMYDKHTDFIETRGAKPDKLAFVPGTANQAPEVDGLRFGVEICFDHGSGVLKKRSLPDLDFHIVVSDSVDSTAANMAMKTTGYFLHASSDPSQSMVVHRTSLGKLVKHALTPPPKENTLSLCLIDSPT